MGMQRVVTCNSLINGLCKEGHNGMKLFVSMKIIQLCCSQSMQRWVGGLSASMEANIRCSINFSLVRFFSYQPVEKCI
ncbi:hypothetical protein YC2023_074505 [Brassica napus]